MKVYELHIRRGRLINDDPQRRCYNGAYFASHIEWEPWELWLKNDHYESLEHAERVARLFSREDQQLKAVAVERETA